MRKHKILLFATLLPIFGLFSCNNNNDPYKDKLTKDYSGLTYTGTLQKEYTSGSKITVGKDFKVTFDKSLTPSEPLEPLGDKSLAKNLYFFTSSNESPTVSMIKPSSTLNTSKPKYQTNIYLAVLNEDNKVYISKPISITITNSKALNPVLYYVGGAVIIVGVALIVFFTKRYKERH